MKKTFIVLFLLAALMPATSKPIQFSLGNWLWKPASDQALLTTSSPTFAGLTLSGGLTVNSGQYLAPSGDSSKPGYSFATSTNSGLYINRYNQLYIMAGGGAAATFDGTTSYFLGATYITGATSIAASQITAGAGTGLTVNSAGHLNRQVYKVTVDYTGFSAAALTADHTIATLPAKTKIVGFYADTTVPFTGGGVTAAALTVGKSAGGVEYIATHDVLSGAVTKGLADADMGTELTRAAAIQGGAVVNWAATTPVSARLTTVTANTDQLTAGSCTFYIVTERY